MSSTVREEAPGAQAAARSHPSQRFPGLRGGPSAQLRVSFRKWLGTNALLLFWIAEIVVFSLLRPDTFGRLQTFQTILGSRSALLVLVLGALFVLTAGEFDLSIGSTMTMGVSVLGYLVADRQVPLAVAIAVVLVLGAVIGLVNGVLVVRMGIPSIIATLGTGTLIGGVTLGIAGRTIRPHIASGLVAFMSRRVGGLRGGLLGVLRCLCVRRIRVRLGLRVRRQRV